MRKKYMDTSVSQDFDCAVDNFTSNTLGNTAKRCKTVSYQFSLEQEGMFVFQSVRIPRKFRQSVGTAPEHNSTQIVCVASPFPSLHGSLMHPDPKRQRTNPSRDTSSNLSMIVCTFSLSIRLKSGKITQDIRKRFTDEFSI